LSSTNRRPRIRVELAAMAEASRTEALPLLDNTNMLSLFSGGFSAFLTAVSAFL
jgi:hypothetical protein